MTRERKEAVVVVALALSVVAHVVLMVYARPKVMTHAVGGFARLVSKGPMRVMQRVPRPESVKIEAVRDLEAVREAPTALAAEIPATEVASAEVRTEPRALEPVPAAAPTPAPEHPVFDTRPIKLDDKVSARIPMAEVVAPLSAVPGPVVGLASGGQIPLAAPGMDVASLGSPEKTSREWCPPPVGGPAEAVARLTEEVRSVRPFKPKVEFSTKVDERLVSEEKVAVKQLMDVAEPAELSPCVNLAATTAVRDGWRYYRIMLTPRTRLPTVPKDIVLVIDASGSIGRDRMGSIRGASKRLLRTITNSADRFNLVAFRDRFSYAFSIWQDCTREAFERGDKWLSNLVAHGRTDVFSTIRSLLTLPRDPCRPLIALVVTDGDANLGISDTSELLARFTALNDGLISVYMYGVRSSANRELIDVLTHGNRGESLIFEGFSWNAGNGIETLAERFRDPVLSDIRVLPSAASRAEVFPRRLRNLYRGDTLELLARTPVTAKSLSFSFRGLNGSEAYEGFFTVSPEAAATDSTVADRWADERAIDVRLQEKVL